MALGFDQSHSQLSDKELFKFEPVHGGLPGFGRRGEMNMLQGLEPAHEFGVLQNIVGQVFGKIPLLYLGQQHLCEAGQLPSSQVAGLQLFGTWINGFQKSTA
ncbi:hypothetical protein D9M68_920190 [compost metagenome]